MTLFAATSENAGSSNIFIQMENFPLFTNGKLNAIRYLNAVSDLITLIERLGKVFAPVKYDMQGNVNKIKKHQFDDSTCILELVLSESNKNNYVVADSVLWLNRALMFFEIVFQEILKCLQANSYNVGMKKIFLMAYDGSVKKYHNWVTQQLFAFICKMSPSLPQIMKSFEVDDNIEAFEGKLSTFNNSLHAVRSKIDEFYLENELLDKI